jgi:DNA-binding FrmR family transcriptional regulator
MIPTAPGLHFDHETARPLEDRLSRLDDHVRHIRRRLLQQDPCEVVQAHVLMLRDEATALAAEVLRAHAEICIRQCVQAGESTAALESLKAALGRVLQHLQTAPP